MEVIFIEPICKEYIWGGTKLQEEYNKKNKFFDVKKIVVKEKFESHSNINTLLMMNVIEGNGKLYDSKKRIYTK